MKEKIKMTSSIVINVKYDQFPDEQMPEKTKPNRQNVHQERSVSFSESNRLQLPKNRLQVEAKKSDREPKGSQAEKTVSFAEHKVSFGDNISNIMGSNLTEQGEGDGDGGDRKISGISDFELPKPRENSKKEGLKKMRKLSERTERKVSAKAPRKSSEYIERKISNMSFTMKRVDENVTFGEERYRFVIITLYCLAASLGAALICTFAPITKTMDKVFHASPFEIYLLTNLYILCGAILNFPLQVIVQKFGRRNSVILGVGLMLVGSILKIFLNNDINFALVGQGICCIGFEFLHSLIGPITCYWFAPNNRVIVFAIATVAYSFGNFLGYLVPTSFVTEDHVDKEANRLEVQSLHTFLAILCGVIFILVVILFKEDPDQPLDQAALVERYEIAESVKILARNKNYILVCVGMASLLSVQYARANSYYYLTTPYGFSQNQASYLSSIESWGEMVGLILVSLIGNRFFKPKKILNFMPVYIAIIFLLTIGAYNTGSFTLTAIFTFLMGLSMNAFPPYCEHYTIGVTFPIHENITVGTLYSGGFWGAVLSGALSALLRTNFSTTIFVWLIYPYFFLLIFVAFAAFNAMQDVNTREQFES